MAERDPGLGKRNRPTADSDFAAWIHHQAAALKDSRFADLDIDDLVILIHMLKWDWQPELRDVSWRKSINASRNRIWGELASSPSFRPRISEAIEQVFESARETAWDETGVFKLEREPVKCPYSWDEIMHRAHELPRDQVPENLNSPYQGDLSSEID